SLAMVDLDDFKRVNDTYGHLAGDALLVALSDRIRKVLRRRQEVYRFGGEEFAVIIPQANLDDAVAVGERICRTVADQPFAVTPQQSVFVTTSVGVATLAVTHQTATDLVGAADGALLEAKARGKNQVAKA